MFGQRRAARSVPRLCPVAEGIELTMLPFASYSVVLMLRSTALPALHPCAPKGVP